MKTRGKMITSALAALLACLAIAPALTQALNQPPVDEIERALEELIDLMGIALPAEKAILGVIAVILSYGWTAIGTLLSLILPALYIAGSFLIALGEFLGVLGEAMTIVGEALSELLFTGFIWLIFSLIGSIIAVNGLRYVGQLLIDISEALEPLKEYFPWP